MSFSPMPMIAVAAAIQLRPGLRGHAGSFTDDPYELEKALGIGILLGLILPLFFWFLVSYFTVETKAIIDAKVVAAIVTTPKKSNGYGRNVVMRLEMAQGYQWQPNEYVSASQCPAVRYNELRPIYIISVKSWFHDYRYASGLVTFCK